MYKLNSLEIGKLKGLESHFRIPRDHFRININLCNDVVATIQLKQARRKPNLIFSAEEFERKKPQTERDMEVGCLTFAAASSTASFLRRHPPTFLQPHDRCHHLLRLSAANVSSSSQNTDSSRGNLSAKASKQSISSQWDVSNYAAPSWLPRFEELDTTNMLLRQRIIFLGSQVWPISSIIALNLNFEMGVCVLINLPALYACKK